MALLHFHTCTAQRLSSSTTSRLARRTKTPTFMTLVVSPHQVFRRLTPAYRGTCPRSSSHKDPMYKQTPPDHRKMSRPQRRNHSWPAPKPINLTGRYLGLNPYRSQFAKVPASNLNAIADSEAVVSRFQRTSSREGTRSNRTSPFSNRSLAYSRFSHGPKIGGDGSIKTPTS